MNINAGDDGIHATSVLQIDGGAPVEVKVGDTGGKFAPFARDVDFTAGLHAVRLSNPWAKMPDIDRMTME